MLNLYNEQEMIKGYLNTLALAKSEGIQNGNI